MIERPNQLSKVKPTYRDTRLKRALFWLALAPVMYAPRWLRYGLADGTALLLRYGLKYRRRVIDDNLRIAFPEKSEAERTAIRHGFYRNFADLIVEQIWAFGASKARVMEMFDVDPGVVPLFERHRAAGRPVMVAAGHHNNYELGAAALSLSIAMPMSVIYSRLVNPMMDRRVLESRERFGMTLWARGNVRGNMTEWRERFGSFAVGFAFDQSPHVARRKYWMPFFGRPTAVQTGLDGYAQRFGAAVVYLYLERRSRGKYRLHFEEVCDDASRLPEGVATARATQHLEAAIRRFPEGWMWSHRRWKLDIARDRLAEDMVVDEEPRPDIYG